MVVGDHLGLSALRTEVLRYRTEVSGRRWVGVAQTPEGPLTIPLLNTIQPDNHKDHNSQHLRLFLHRRPPPEVTPLLVRQQPKLRLLPVPQTKEILKSALKQPVPLHWQGLIQGGKRR